MYAGWFDTHLLVDALIIAGCGIITLTAVIWSVRTLLKDMKEDAIQREEERREHKLFRHRMRSTILQAKEWDLDAEELELL